MKRLKNNEKKAVSVKKKNHHDKIKVKITCLPDYFKVRD